MQEAPTYTPADHTAASVLEGRYAWFMDEVLSEPRPDGHDAVDNLAAAMWDRDDYALLTNDDDFSTEVRAALAEYIEAAWDNHDAWRDR